MGIRRRDLLALGGGLTAGVMITPVPWTLLDDTAKWTQNGPWIPRLPRGPVEVKPSFCTLCSRGCGVQVRMAAGAPVGIAGMRQHPVNRGALCPLAFAAHQLNWHPRRARQVAHRGRGSNWNDAVAAFRSACSEGPVMIADGWRGRAASAIYKNFADRQGGAYRPILSDEEQSLDPIAEWSGVSPTALGYDLDSARTVLSFGTPLLDGWGAPGRVARLWAERSEWLIQVDSSLSRTASSAWQWIRILDGGAEALACGLARVVLEERLVLAKGPAPAMTLAESAVRTGLTESAIRQLARMLVQRRPVVAIAAGRSPAVAALNAVLGNVGARGGILRRSGAAAYTRDEPRRYRAVVIDSTVPWDFRPPEGAEVFRFAAWDGGASRADWILPAPGLFEELTDVPTAPGETADTYSIAEKLLPIGPEVHTGIDLIAAVDSRSPRLDALIKARCLRLFQSRDGAVHGEGVIPVQRLESAAKLEELLRGGAVWQGSRTRTGGLDCILRSWPSDGERLPARDWTGSWAPPVLPPLATKLYRDSRLRPAPAWRQI